MAYVLIEHRVGDFEIFKKVYLDDAGRRGRLGSRGGLVFRVADDPDNVIVMLEWDSVERARDFAGSLELEIVRAIPAQAIELDLGGYGV